MKIDVYALSGVFTDVKIFISCLIITRNNFPFITYLLHVKQSIEIVCSRVIIANYGPYFPEYLWESLGVTLTLGSWLALSIDKTLRSLLLSYRVIKATLDRKIDLCTPFRVSIFFTIVQSWCKNGSFAKQAFRDWHQNIILTYNHSNCINTCLHWATHGAFPPNTLVWIGIHWSCLCFHSQLFISAC